MYETMTQDYLLQQSLAIGEADGVDTRQGSLFYDAEVGNCLITARQYADLSTFLPLTHIATATGDELTIKAQEYLVERIPAVAAKYNLSYTGTRPTIGDRFFAADNKYFTVQENEDGDLLLVAETPGVGCNYIDSGTEAVPVNTIIGLTASSFGEMYELGADTETDDNLRRRVKEALTPAENGNKQHYKTWCESVAGIGRARILPLWNGQNTVKAVLYGTDGLPATSAVVEDVQDYIDPGSTGLGEGIANIGAYFTAAAATAVNIVVVFTGYFTGGYTAATAKNAVETAIEDYFKNLALNVMTDSGGIVRIGEIASVILGLEPILDYKSLTLNGNTSNISISNLQAPVLTTVTINTGVTGISLNKATTSLAVDATETLTATLAPTGATDTVVTWESSDDTKATVSSSGVVTGVAGGTATITATSHDGSFTATCAVTVTA